MTSTQIRYWTAGISVASGILALGDKVVAIHSLPGWLTSSWPFVLAGAAIFNNVAHILITPDPTPAQPAQYGLQFETGSGSGLPSVAEFNQAMGAKCATQPPLVNGLRTDPLPNPADFAKPNP